MYGRPVDLVVPPLWRSDVGIRVWDLAVKPMDPIVFVDTSVTGKRLTCVAFSPTAPGVLIYGDADGGVTVARINNVLSKEDGCVMEPEGKDARAAAFIALLRSH